MSKIKNELLRKLRSYPPQDELDVLIGFILSLKNDMSVKHYQDTVLKMAAQNDNFSHFKVTG